MTDEEAKMLFEIYAQRAKQRPEKSHALPSYKYGNPERNASFKRQKWGNVDRQSNAEIADSLLIEWHRWCKQWRPNLGAPKISPACRGYRQDEKHNDESDGYEAIHQKEMEAVDFCVGTLAVSMQQAIGTEMRNREVKAKVWRDRGNSTFEQALYAVLVEMRKHRDLMSLFS